MTITEEHHKLARKFFSLYVPPDAKWYVESVLVEGLADAFAAHDAELERRVRLEEAKFIKTRVSMVQFRVHSRDDVEFHSGCVQTHERDLGAIMERIATLESMPESSHDPRPT